MDTRESFRERAEKVVGNATRDTAWRAGLDLGVMLLDVLVALLIAIRTSQAFRR